MLAHQQAQFITCPLAGADFISNLQQKTGVITVETATAKPIKNHDSAPKVICPMPYSQLKSWNLTGTYSHNYKTTFINALYYWGQKIKFLNSPCKFQLFMSASSSSIFSIMSNSTQAYKELEKLQITENTLFCNIEIFQIHYCYIFIWLGCRATLTIGTWTERILLDLV